MKEANQKIKRTFFIRLFKIIFYSLLIFFTIIFILTGVIYYKKDDISRRILQTVTTQTRGEFSFQDINVTPFAQFPSISLTLIEPEYYETPESSRDSLEKPIIHLSNLHVAFDILELFKSRIEVTKILIENGEINLIQYPDSTYNILNAVQTSDDLLGRIGGRDKQNQDSLSIIPDLIFSLNQIALTNVSINFDNQTNGRQHLLNIEKSKASFNLMPDSIKCDLLLKIDVQQMQLTDKIAIREEALSIETNFYFNRPNQKINIHKSIIGLGNAKFNLNGKIDLRGDGMMDLSYEADDKNLQFTNLYLTSEGINHLNSGTIYFNGTIKGQLKNEFPLIQCFFGAEDLNISIPNTTESIKDLKMEGYFSSGKKPDFSNASLKVDTLSAIMPEGYVMASFDLYDFKAPKVKYILDLKTRIDELDRIFNFQDIRNLEGMISYYDEYEGYYDKDIGWVDILKGEISMMLDSVSFSLPKVMDVSYLNGNLSGNLDSLNVDELSILTGNTDLLINGNIHNIYDILIDKGSTIGAHLTIQSEMYDFPDFFSFLPVVAKSFPYQITDSYVEVKVNTTHNKLTKFNKVPELKFTISRFNGTIKEFLPYTEISNGVFILREADSTSILDFTEFDIKMAGSDIEADFHYYNLPGTADSMIINLLAEKLNPSKIILTDVNDSIPDILEALIDGELACKVTLSEDSAYQFKTINIDASEMYYRNVTDTLNLKSLLFEADMISFDLSSNSNPLTTLSAQVKLEAEEINYSLFHVSGVQYTINAVNGKYTIIPEKSKWFGTEGEGIFTTDPFGDPPSHSLAYSLKQFQIEEFLSSFYSDTIISGLMNIDIDLQFTGSDWESITSTMDGKIDLTGLNMVFHGMDIDNLINKFKRSQSFNLIDVGAVILTGPVGLVYTKGSDYALILTANPGETTNISSISSSWTIEEGRLLIEDVAFATLDNRLAAKGWLDMKVDSLDLTIAVIDKDGCSIINQNISGYSKDPVLSKVKVISTLFAPVTNLIEGITNKDCDKFYQGIVLHPEE